MSLIPSSCLPTPVALAALPMPPRPIPPPVRLVTPPYPVFEGVYMAPNFVYPCCSSTCVTETVQATKPDFVSWADANAVFAADAITRGSLSGMQPLVSNLGHLAMPGDIARW